MISWKDTSSASGAHVCDRMAYGGISLPTKVRNLCVSTLMSRMVKRHRLANVNQSAHPVRTDDLKRLSMGDRVSIGLWKGGPWNSASAEVFARASLDDRIVA